MDLVDKVGLQQCKWYIFRSRVGRATFYSHVQKRFSCFERVAGNITRPLSCEQWSRLKPSYEFHFEGLLYFSASVEGLVQIQEIQEYRNEIQTHIKLVHELYGEGFQYNVKN